MPYPKLRSGLFLIGFMTIVLLVAGCSGGEPEPPEDAHLTVLVADQGPSALGVQTNELLDKSKQLVEENNPGVTIDVVRADPMEYESKIEELRPDIFWISPAAIESLEEQGKLLDLGPAIENAGVDIREYYPEQLLGMTTANGKLLGIPQAAYNLAIGYSKTWFDNAGISYPTEDWTWEDFESIAVRLKEANGADSPSKYGAMIPLFPEYVEPLVMSKGGAYMSEDGTATSGFWDGQPAVDTMVWLKRLIDNGVIPALTGPDMGTSFQKLGTETGMVMSLLPIVRDMSRTDAGDIGIINLPRFADGERVSAPYVTAFGISAGTEHPQAAWKYVQALTMDDNAITREAFRMGLSVSSEVFKEIGEEIDPAIALDYNQLPFAQRRASMLSPEWGNLLNRFAGPWAELLTSTDEDFGPALKRMAGEMDVALANVRVEAAASAESSAAASE